MKKFNCWLTNEQKDRIDVELNGNWRKRQDIRENTNHEEHTDRLLEVLSLLKKDKKVFMKIIDVSHKNYGSIMEVADLEWSPPKNYDPEGSLFRKHNYKTQCVPARFKLKSDKPKKTLTLKDKQVAWLQDYNGSCNVVCCSDFDVINEYGRENIYDIRRNAISIGADCVYVNLRYGQSTQLSLGTVMDIVPNVIRPNANEEQMRVEHTVIVANNEKDE